MTRHSRKARLHVSLHGFSNAIFAEYPIVCMISEMRYSQVILSFAAGEDHDMAASDESDHSSRDH